jgi:hypothetical protein
MNFPRLLYSRLQVLTPAQSYTWVKVLTVAVVPAAALASTIVFILDVMVLGA